MGVYVYIDLSKSITKEEWTSVYNESLELLKVFPFAERQRKKIDTNEVVCLTRTKERKSENGNGAQMKWIACGDMETLECGEEFVVRKNLIDEYNPHAGDALLALVPNCTNHSFEEEKFNQTYRLSAKTQGRKYHLYLLCLACMMESRLQDKAIVSGDISKGQLELAVELANSKLKSPVTLPSRCDMNKLYTRISKLDIPNVEKILTFVYLYLGQKNDEFGNFIREKFPSKTCYEFLTYKLNSCRVGTYGFSEHLKELLVLGFDLREICRAIDFAKKFPSNDDSVEIRCKKFIDEIMDTKLYLREKNTEDILADSPDDIVPPSVEKQFAQIAFMGARNKKVERYIPIDQLRLILREELKNYSATEKYIDEYLNAEAKEKDKSNDVSDRFMETLKKIEAEQESLQEKYNIYAFEQFLHYKRNDSVTPSLLKNIKSGFKSLKTLLEENSFKELQMKTAEELCEWIVKRNSYLLLRDTDWEKIFKNIKENPQSFERYYLSVMIPLNDGDIKWFIYSLVLNDDFYAFLCKAEC